MAGTVVEWYEFFLYGTAATLVFGKVFFPASDSAYGAIFAAFLTYAVGFIARPLGGVVFGHFGDKHGRKKLLQFAILLVGVVTFLMGCLPTYDQIGIWAPVLLVTLALPPGLRRRRRVGRRRAAGRRAQPEQVPRLLGELAAGRRAGRQPARHRRAVGADRDAVRTATSCPGAGGSPSGCPRWWCWSATTSVPRSPTHRSSLRHNRKSSASRPSPTASSRCSSGIRAACSPRWACGSPRTSCTTSWSRSRSRTSRCRSAWTPTRSCCYMIVAHAVHFAVIPLVGRLADRVGRKARLLRRRCRSRRRGGSSRSR